MTMKIPCLSLRSVCALSISIFAASTVFADSAIESPSFDELIYDNMIELSAYDTGAVENAANWAVREGTTCDVGTTNVAGNVGGFDDAFTWMDGKFAAWFDATGLPGGEYCFVLNTTVGAADGSRLVQPFILLDKYVKVGGTLNMGGLKGKGNSPTHALDGFVGLVVGSDVYGSITVNYRELGEYITYEAEDLTFRAAAGIGVTDPMAVGAIELSMDEAGNTGTILVLDRDATEDFPRGAIIVRPFGEPTNDVYEIDATPGEGGADSWVPMDRGNNHTGTRQ